MKTNRISSIRRLAIIVGTVLAASQAAAATVGPVAPAPAADVKAPAPKPVMVALACTRVGPRMVC